MNYAIYFVAVGDSATKCLKLAYRSLREAGFAGDVYILTDGTDMSFKTSANTRVVCIKEEDLNLDFTSTAPMAACDVRRFNKATISKSKYHSFNKWAIANVRTLVDSYISFEKYDYILYLDVDVLSRGPAQKFEKFMEQHRGSILISAAKDSRRLGGRGNFSLKKLRRAKTTEAANLTTWELLKYWFVQPICSDIVCFPTNELGKRFIRGWRVECQKGIYQDQAALQAILLRQFRDNHVLTPYSIFGYGPKHYQYAKDKKLEEVNSVFIHFGGAIKDSTAFEKYEKHYLSKPHAVYTKPHAVYRIPSYRALRLLFFHRNQYRSQFIRRIRYYFVRLGIKRFYDHGGAGYIFELYELIRKKRVEVAHTNEMYAILDTIQAYLPSAPGTILDIGAGLGGIDLTLYHYFDSHPTLYLIDKEGVSPNRHGGYHVSAKDFPHYNSFRCSRRFLEVNGVPAEKIKTINIATSSFPTEKFDLVISLLSWGFHFSVDTYIQDVYKQLNKGGRLILDIRKGKDGMDVLRKVFGVAPTVLHNGRDFIRVGIEKQ